MAGTHEVLMEVPPRQFRKSFLCTAWRPGGQSKAAQTECSLFIYFKHTPPYLSGAYSCTVSLVLPF